MICVLQKKKLIINKLLLGWLLLSAPAYGQIVINLPQANITARSNYTATLASGTYSSLIGLVPNIEVKANSPNFTNTVGGTSTVPLNIAHIRLRSIGSLSLIGVTAEVTLSTSYALLYAALASISSGAVIADYRISTGSHTWISGIYRAPINFRTGLLSPNQITPTTPNLDINVPGFIAPQATLSSLSLPVNNLSFFRNSAGISAAGNISVSTTVPYLLSLQASNTQFSFNTNSSYNQTPSTSVGLVNSTLSNITNATPIMLSTTSQALTAASGIAVPTNNNQALTAAFSITGNNLKTGFVQAGTYSVPITYTWSKLASAYPTGSLQVQRSSTLQVIVSDLAELIALQPSVNFVFDDVTDYRQGITRDMTQHLRISKTTPYSLYVRSSTANFSGAGGQIPVNILRIGASAGQTGVNTVTLSTTPQQLINNANPTIDRTLDIRYSIPNTAMSQLLGKAPGTYSATVIYSFTTL